jgi:radical SAM/Cys-rich protein
MGSTLVHQRSPLANAARQRALLASGGRGGAFEQALAEHGLGPLRASGLQVLQINVGKRCNQTCRHCHVDAGPDRREVMSRETMELCLDAVSRARIPCVDITGGAPELNPDFRYLVAEARRRGAHVIDRCNLTILMAPGYRDLPEFLAEQGVEVVASLPCYTAGNTDSQRGDGVFVRSLAALRRLNDIGYGRPGGDLVLTLVFNPLGPVLPPGQEALEADYRRELAARHGIVFTRLYTITNMPISRFLDHLVRAGELDRYMETLSMAFNPATVAGLMCRTTVSVSWDGQLHDCDFNQMLELPLAPRLPRHIRDLDESLRDRAIVVGPHCFGCTAGHGSGCQGAVVP